MGVSLLLQPEEADETKGKRTGQIQPVTSGNQGLGERRYDWSSRGALWPLDS